MKFAYTLLKCAVCYAVGTIASNLAGTGMDMLKDKLTKKDN